MLPRRHAILRTRFGVRGSDPVQIVDDEAQLPVTEHDVATMGPGAKELAVSAILEAAARKPFDLEVAPLANVHVVRLAEDDHVVLMVLHHIIGDMRAFSVLVRDVLDVYHAVRVGRAVADLRDDGRYAAYAIAERALDDSHLAECVAFWRDYLAGAPASSEFPADRTRPAMQSFAGGYHDFVLPAELVADLRLLAGRENATLFTVISTAYAILLMRYGGQSDVVFGVPTANRDRPVEHLAGLFINMVPVRAQFDGAVPFVEALAKVRSSMAAAFERQHVPFEKVVEAIGPPRDPSRNPMFQTMLSYRWLEVGSARQEGLEIRSERWPFTGRAQNDVTLLLEKDEDAVRGRFEYASDLFAAETVRRLANSFETLLRSIAANPRTTVDALVLLSDEERQRLLVEWNATDAAYASDRCVHQLFEAQAARNPHAVAVVHGDTQLTYVQLNARANQLARYLRSIGVEPGACVALCLQRSIALVIAELAVLKCGAVYVPLDSMLPQTGRSSCSRIASPDRRDRQ